MFVCSVCVFVSVCSYVDCGYYKNSKCNTNSGYYQYSLKISNGLGRHTLIKQSRFIEIL